METKSPSFNEFLPIGQKVVICCNDPALDGKIGFIESDRIDSDSLPEVLKDSGPFRYITVEHYGQTFCLRESALRIPG